ncbi:diacylglycerol/lipid kinase family protein [Carnobacterium inhibens]|uniref:diacylglycerol/lipid kinase family protein n=1 Tax=Carnobacterium inhibens TaxID=147709 RepID=UPI00203F5DD9|nr:diacylglycerol kinase family protein [Carnobacterium inhibens]MCM3511297.1 diacylglycerol kinase family lipid kinase [Carnobacterium inhibens]
MTKAMIIVNPSSGAEESENYTEKLKKQLDAVASEFVIKKTKKSGDAKEFSEEAALNDYEAVFVLGGDGTVSEAVNGLMLHESKLPLGIIPLGTVNNVARAVGIPMNPEKAIDSLEQLTVQQIDVGKLNDRFFISSTSVGPIPESVQEVDVDMKTKFGVFAYLIEGIKALKNDETYTFELDIDGEKWTAEYSLLLIAMSNFVGGVGTIIPEAAIDDGLIHLVTLKETTAKEKLSLVPELFQNKEYTKDQLEHRSFKKARIRLVEDIDKEINCTVDGDKGQTFPLEIEVLPQALSVFA